MLVELAHPAGRQVADLVQVHLADQPGRRGQACHRPGEAPADEDGEENRNGDGGQPDDDGIAQAFQFGRHRMALEMGARIERRSGVGIDLPVHENMVRAVYFDGVAFQRSGKFDPQGPDRLPVPHTGEDGIVEGRNRRQGIGERQAGIAAGHQGVSQDPVLAVQHEDVAGEILECVLQVFGQIADSDDRCQHAEKFSVAPDRPFQSDDRLTVLRPVGRRDPDRAAPAPAVDQGAADDRVRAEPGPVGPDRLVPAIDHRGFPVGIDEDQGTDRRVGRHGA